MPLQEPRAMPGGLIVVVNPRAGVGRAASAVRQACARLGADAADAIQTTLDSGFAAQLARAVASASPPVTVVCVGGDGTLSMVVNALASPESVRLAVVPAGSGNDFGAALGIRTQAEGIDAAAGVRTRRVDVGTINGRRFVNCVGMGLDGEIARSAASIRARGLARGLSYYVAALGGLWRVRPVGARIDSPAFSGRIADLLMLTVGNGPWYGGGYHGAPGALIDDGQLDCHAYANLAGGFKRLALMERIRKGTHRSHPVVTTLRTPALTVAFDREIPMHVDGELTSASTVDIAVVRGGLSFAAP